MSLLEQIRAADKNDLKAVEVPEWKLTVYVRQLTLGDRDSLDNEAYLAREAGKGLDGLRTRFLARVLCDETGQPLCKPGEFSQLAELSAKPLERIFEIAQEHCKLDEDAIEDAAKN